MSPTDTYGRAVLDRLAENFRSENETEKDIDQLNGYISTFDPALVGTVADVNARLAHAEHPGLLTARVKRTKSIVRKLLREPKMHLDRMTDIVGLRHIVLDVAGQDYVTKTLFDIFEEPRVRDYRDIDLDGGRLYRSIHITGRHDSHFVELQIRTIPQHLWATESENLGEQAKEGKYHGEEESYLRELAVAVRRLDNGSDASAISLATKMAALRSPLTFKLSRLLDGFALASSIPQRNPASSYLVTHDQVTNEIINSYYYLPQHREEALVEFRRLSSLLDANRFNVLVLNSASEEALRVTHPRFFGF
jgi:ppGpp synthetase/RelA/SpoT-type nucleotidyltranferase